MKKLMFRPYYDMVKPLIHGFADDAAGGSTEKGEDEGFDLSKIGKEEGEEGEGEEEEAGGEEEETQETESDDTDDSETGGEGEEEAEEGSEGEEGDESSEEDESGEKGEEGSKKDGSEGDDDGDESGEGDFFGDVNAEEDSEDLNDFTPLATDLGIELKDPKNRIEFIEKVNEQIKSAQKQFDLSEYDDTSQRLIKFANDKGDLTEFFTSPKISQFNHFLNLDAEGKFAEVRSRQLRGKGMDAEAIGEKIEEEMSELSTRELKDLGDGYDREIKEALNEEVVSILGDKETQIAEAKSKAESEIADERQQLIKYVDSQKDFMGLPLTEANKKGIINAINNGTFDVTVEQNPAASKFNAFMLNKFYAKFVQQIESATKDASRQGYGKGLKKGKGTAYNQDPKDSGAKDPKRGNKRWADLQDIE